MSEQITQQTIRLDFVDADEKHPDPAMVGSFGREVIKQLEKNGYNVQPFYTGEKGGEHFILTIIQTAWDHREAIEGTVGGFIGGTASNFGNIKTIIETIEKVQEKLGHVHQNIEGVTVKLLSDGTETISGSPKAASQYVAERLKAKEESKNLEVSVRVPAKPKRRK